MSLIEANMTFTKTESAGDINWNCHVWLDV